MSSAASAAAQDSLAPGFACLNCTRRKVRCDKSRPKCSSCIKTKLDCVYQSNTPATRGRKRRQLSSPISDHEVSRPRNNHGSFLEWRPVDPPSERPNPRSPDVLDPLENGKNGFRPENHDSLPKVAQDHPRTWVSAAAPSIPGTILTAPGRSRYIASSHWEHLGHDEVDNLSNDDDEVDAEQQQQPSAAMEPLVAAFMGLKSPAPTLCQYYPSHADATALFRIHCERVEPICKIIHIPSTWNKLQTASKHPDKLSSADQCLHFSIYHFAVFSLTDDECVTLFKQSRCALRQRYATAARLALANASFLQTTTMSVLQALVLFLLAGRDHYDAHTYWIMTGVAVRIAQRMGVHKDGEALGLPPFEIELRRRLFYQLLPLDGRASQMSGTGILALSTNDTLDTQPPLNVNDSDIWPGMTNTPAERKGATELSFFLARMCIVKLLMKVTHAINRGLDAADMNTLIAEAETEVEDKFIRYCDMTDPLHVLTAVLTRSAVTTVRSRCIMPKWRAKTITFAERNELLQLSLKILDADSTAYSYPGMKKYMWYLSSFFVYGSWDALIFVITTLRRPDLRETLFSNDVDAAWTRVEQVYTNHPQLLEQRKQPLHVALGRLCLKAWNANPPTSSASLVGEASTVDEPEFIAALRAASMSARRRREQPQSGSVYDGPSPNRDQMPTSDADALFGIGFDLDPSFTLDDVDWEFWDQLISFHEQSN